MPGIQQNMGEGPLYDDGKVKIDYYSNAPEEHVLHITDKKGESSGYLIQRGILRELAQTKRGGIESKISNFNDNILFAIKNEGISIDGLHVALCQAYSEEERRMNEFIKSQKK